jgi:hypothetical protein
MKKFFRDHWRTILEVVGLLAVIFAYMQYKLQQQQFSFEKPYVTIIVRQLPPII